MPPSQLKRLKTSLREQGVTGPQKSKKQKKQASKNGAFRDNRIQRNAALAGIREQFNPFEIRAPGRPSKHDVASSKTSGKGMAARPGVTKGFGEEQVRQHPFLLPNTLDNNFAVAPSNPTQGDGEA